jgi:hypothetical protein
MPKNLKDIDETSTATDAVNALKNCNDKRLELKGGGGGHNAVSWSVFIEQDDEDEKGKSSKQEKKNKDKNGKEDKKARRKEKVASGSIPMDAHNAKNLPTALKALITARDKYDLK